MADYFAIKAGNWNDTTVWDSGIIPTSTDVVYTNGFVVTVNDDVNVTQLRNGSNAGQLPNMCVPVMTSNTTPSGVASASVNSTSAFNAFNGVGWFPGTSAYILTYQFSSAKIIKRFRIVSTYNNTPNAFTFEGSNDNFATIAFTFSGTMPNTSSINNYVSAILSNTTACLAYRLNVTTSIGTPRIYNFDMTESIATTNGTNAAPLATGGYYSVTALPTLPTQRTITVSNATSGIVNTGGSVNVFQISATSGTININHATLGNVVGGDSLQASYYNIYSLPAANCTININGNLFGNTVTAGGSARSNGAFGVFGPTNVNIIGNLTAGNMYYDGNAAFGSCAIVVGGTAGSATINITGNLLGQQANLGGNGSDALYLIGNSATVNITGNITGGLFSALRSWTTYTGNINIPTGTITSSSTTLAIKNEGSGFVTINSPVINTNNNNGIYSSRVRLYSTAQIQWLFQNSAGSNTILYSAGASLGMPLTTDVKSGVVFGASNELTGVLVMPLPSNVRIGVLTDNTTGTGQLLAEDFLNAIQSSSNVSAIRLKNVSTTQSTGDQLSSFSGA